MIFVEIFHNFDWFFYTRIRCIEADPDPADQNETDPNGSGSARLFKINKCSIISSLFLFSQIIEIYIIFIFVLGSSNI